MEGIAKSMSKTIIHEPKMEELLDELQELRKNKDWKSAERISEILTELYDNYNPTDNEIDLGDAKVKWKIDPNVGALGKTKFEIELNKDIKDDDVQLSFKINGNGESFTSPPKESGLRAQMGIKIKL